MQTLESRQSDLMVLVNIIVIRETTKYILTGVATIINWYTFIKFAYISIDGAFNANSASVIILVHSLFLIFRPKI